jgi:hypothetical protein
VAAGLTTIQIIIIITIQTAPAKRSGRSSKEATIIIHQAAVLHRVELIHHPIVILPAAVHPVAAAHRQAAQVRVEAAYRGRGEINIKSYTGY